MAEIKGKTITGYLIVITLPVFLVYLKRSQLGSNLKFQKRRRMVLFQSKLAVTVDVPTFTPYRSKFREKESKWEGRKKENKEG